MEYEDFESLMENERCQLCDSMIEMPYDGVIICSNEDDENITLSVVCSYCWPRIQKSMKRIRKKILKEIKTERF